MSLIAHWTLDETSGVSFADTAGAWPAQIGSGITIGQLPLIDSLGKSILSETTSSPSAVANSAPLVDFSSAFSVSAVLSINNRTGTLGLCTLAGVGGKSFAAFSVPTSPGNYGHLAFGANNSSYSNERSIAFPNFAFNKAFHILIVWDGHNFQAYVNGSGVTISTTASWGIVSNTSMINAISGIANTSWSGGIDDLRVYDHALSSAEAVDLYSSYFLTSKVSGNAKLDNGSPASMVLVRDWVTHAHVGAVVPTSSGDFQQRVAAGKYDITVIGPAGYQPVTHGPVDAAAL